MKKNPRFQLFLIIMLTILAILVNIPIKEIFPFANLSFKRGLDLAGGTSLTYKADMKDVPGNQKEKAIAGAKTVIERRINLFGVSEPVVQTASGNNDYRIIVELPGVNIDQAKEIIGTTAELSFWETGASTSAKIASPSAELYLKKTNLSGKDLKETNVVFDPNTGKPQVELKFTSEGTKKFAEITKRNVNKPLAMVLDNQLIDSPPPVVKQPILDGNAVITGDFTLEKAKAMSTALNAGALPVPLIPLQEHAVDATLGEASLLKSLMAGILGIVIIIIFMIVLYGRLGVVSSVALVLYTLFVLAIFKLSSLTPYGITLTLSGIAGFILSIGMAVDANILIFERMKEEKRLGRSGPDSLNLGFARAWSSIRDSNVASLITSVVLYQYGTGAVRGFAITLAIGVLVSMFSAVVVTRTFLRVIYK